MDNISCHLKSSKALLVSLLLLLSSCASYEQFQYLTEEYEIPSKVFKSDFNETWRAVLEIMKRYDLATTSQEAGIIKTRWIDNTLEVNFADSFGSKDAVKAARFKLVINVVKGFRGNREVSKVSIFKRQMVERDFLQGYKVIPSDGILEKTILYRIERLVLMEKRLKAIEEKKRREEEESF